MKLCLSLLLSLFALNSFAKTTMSCSIIGSEMSFKIAENEEGKPFLYEYEKGQMISSKELTFGKDYGQVAKENFLGDDFSDYVLETMGVSINDVFFARYVYLDGIDVQLITYHAKNETQLAGAILITAGFSAFCK